LIRRSFIQLPGIGIVTERILWDSGILSWDDLVESDYLPPNISRRLPGLEKRLDECRRRLETYDGAFFQSCFPSSERWRLYADFRSRTAFLDIETTGISPVSSYITMVGVLDTKGYTSYVTGENLEYLPECLEAYDLIITFNGTSFDLPYLTHYFGDIFRNKAHLDLRYPLKQLGYSGGLKVIEQTANVGRPSEFAALNGYDAVLMWRMWLNGDEGARNTLVRYNAEDVASLPELADLVHHQLQASLPLPPHTLDSWPRVIDELPYDPKVIKYLIANKQP